jgi:ArsR family transcriptional regulator
LRPRRGAEAEAFERLRTVLQEAAAEIPEAEEDIPALAQIMRRRQDKVRAYFDDLAGKFGRHYVPGRSWKGLAETLLTLLPPLVIADLGAGEGTFSQLLARRAKKVIAVDNSEKMVEYGTELARKHGVKNLEYRFGDIQEIPIRTGTVDLAFFSQALHHAQHPERAVAEAYRILKPGGRIVVLDLLRHSYQEARELYADVWLGFTEAEVFRFLTDAGFRHVETSIVHREEESPHFQTLLTAGDRP